MLITKLTKQISTSTISDGLVLLIDKDKSKTSFDVIRSIRRKLNIKKVGHAGTLDPMATGLLIVCTGKKTKEINTYQGLYKIYIGTITLGKSTPSMDAETEPIFEKSIDNINEEQLEKVRQSFLGKIEQIPPMYSALKHKGKSLYKYARKGIIIKREPREVTVYDFAIKSVNLPDIEFEIKCSKGTYIRVIANDFGNKLGCGGYLSSLRRTAIGEYRVNDSLTIKEFNEIDLSEN